jgi:hypothetical protein
MRNWNDVLEGAHVGGRFEVGSDREVVGELRVSGEQTELYLTSKDDFPAPGFGQDYIKGSTHELTKLSLFRCIRRSGPIQGTRNGERFVAYEVFPHEIVHGSRHLGKDEAAVREISFRIDDGDALFYDFDAFGHVLNPEPFIEVIANANSAVTGRKVETGPVPQIAYFDGKTDLLTAVTAIGEVNVRRGVAYNLGGPGGVKLEGRLSFAISFEEPVTLAHAIDAQSILLRFLELIAGRPQNCADVAIKVGSEGDETYLQVYRSSPRARSQSAERQAPSPRDVLIDATGGREATALLLANWIEADQKRRDARVRFSHAFSNQRFYSEDRLIAASNMFDILPSSAVPPDADVGADLASARDKAITLFLELPATPQRDSVLSALGRVGKNNLRSKILHRALLVNAAVRPLIPEVDFVIGEAVKCRNHYVHGSEPSFDYRGEGRDLPTFFTDALEFIFGASELIEAGWGMQAWKLRGTGEHPFADVLRVWPLAVSDLKRLIAEAKELRGSGANVTP